MNSSTNILQLMVTPNTDPTDGNKSVSLKLSFDQVSETIIYRSNRTWLITCKEFSVNAHLCSFVLTGATSTHTGPLEKQF